MIGRRRGVIRVLDLGRGRGMGRERIEAIAVLTVVDFPAAVSLGVESWVFVCGFWEAVVADKFLKFWRERIIAC